jgi:hypothetical protein
MLNDRLYTLRLSERPSTVRAHPMVSLLHEGALKLVRDRPAFAADLLGQLLGIKVPSFREARLDDATLNQLVPVESRADALVVFTRKKPVFGAIVEAQLKPDEEKLFAWPHYAVAARARHRCPFVVVVVTPKRSTASWAGETIELGGGNQYTPLVVGPEGIPRLTDRKQAVREPQLAILSVMAHGRGEVKTAAAIGTAAAHAISKFSEDQRLLYSLLIESNLSAAARKAIEMEPGLEKFFTNAQRRNFERGKTEGKAEGKAEGVAKGKAESLLTILTGRGLTLTADQRRRITACTDLAMLEQWLARSLSVGSVDELLASRPRARQAAKRGRPAPANGRHRSR